MRRVLLVALLLMLLMPSRVARPAPACETTRVATIPLTVVDGRMLLALTVNGRPATFQLDTGAALSLVTPEAVRRLALARDRWIASTVAGIGGVERRSVANAGSILLGGIALRERTSPHGPILAVGTLAAPQVGGHPIDGLLGRDLLGAFDAEFDLAKSTVALWRVRNCAGRFLPWTGTYDTIPALAAYGEALVIPVRANGVVLRALPDTGSTEILVTAPGMARLGLSPGVTTGSATGVGGRLRPTLSLHLAGLRIGGEMQHDVPALGSALRVYPIVDMLLGADWFAAHRVWLSYTTRQVFVAVGP